MTREPDAPGTSEKRISRRLLLMGGATVAATPLLALVGHLKKTSRGYRRIKRFDLVVVLNDNSLAG